MKCLLKFFDDSNLPTGTLFHSNKGNYKLLFMNIVLCSIGPCGLHGCVAGRIVSVVDDAKAAFFQLGCWAAMQESIHIVYTGVDNGLVERREFATWQQLVKGGSHGHNF
jgi:hypothetical protein